MKTILAFAFATILISCSSRRSEVQTSYVKATKDSSASQASKVHRVSSKDSAGTQAASTHTDQQQLTQSVDTGRRTTVTKTTITAQFPAGKGPTAGDVAAAAGDKEKTAALFNNASLLITTTERTTQDQRGKTLSHSVSRSTDSAGRQQSQVQQQNTTDSVGNKAGQIHQTVDSGSKKKNTERTGSSPIGEVAMVIGGILLLVGLIWYLVKK